MTDNTSDTPRVLSCRGTADFLAALPQLAGFTATHSLFVVFFHGSRASQAMRVDLPPDDLPPATAELLEFLSYAIHRFGDFEGLAASPAVAIMSRQSFAECNGPPWHRLARRIERRLRRDRVPLRELCVQAPDGWLSFLDPAAPRSGRSLDEIEESPITAAARLARLRIPPLEDLGQIPATDLDRAARAAAAIAASGIAASSFAECAPITHGAEPDGLAMPAENAESTFARAYGERIERAAEATRTLRATDLEHSPEEEGRLAAIVSQPDSWWHVALGLLTRPEFPGQLAREFGMRHFALIPVDDVPAARAHGETETTVRTNTARTSGCTMRSLLAGTSPLFTERERLGELRTRLAQSIADAPDLLRPGLFALSAFVWWLSGNQSTAHRHLDGALAIDPDHAISVMVRSLVSVPLAAQQSVLPNLSSGAGRFAPPRAEAS